MTEERETLEERKTLHIVELLNFGSRHDPPERHYNSILREDSVSSDLRSYYGDHYYSVRDFVGGLQANILRELSTFEKKELQRIVEIPLFRKPEHRKLPFAAYLEEWLTEYLEAPFKSHEYRTSYGIPKEVARIKIKEKDLSDRVDVKDLGLINIFLINLDRFTVYYNAEKRSEIKHAVLEDTHKSLRLSYPLVCGSTKLAHYSTLSLSGNYTLNIGNITTISAEGE